MPDRELTQRLEDHSGVGDGIVAVVRDESGEVREVRRGGLKAMAQRLAVEDDLEQHDERTLRAIAEDEGVKLPKGSGRRRVLRSLAARRGGLPVGEIAFEGEPDELKGPGPQWERDEEGNYVNRD